VIIVFLIYLVKSLKVFFFLLVQHKKGLFFAVITQIQLIAYDKAYF